MAIRADGGGGGGSTESGTIPWPPVDLASLWEAGNCLQTTAKRLSADAADVSSSGSGVSSWSGSAADAWHSDVKASLSGLDQVSERLGAAGRILSNLFDDIEGLQGQYQTAVSQEVAARTAIKNLPVGAAHMETVAGIGPQADLSRAISAEERIVGDVHSAAGAAAGRLQGLSGGLPALLHLGHVGAIPGPSRSFLTMLLGSIADNRASGRAFQEWLNQVLNGAENTQRFTVSFRGANGQWLTRTVIPDRFGYGLGEDKSVGYQSFVSQLRAEIQLARNSEVPFQLAVPQGAKLSGPLQSELQALESEPQQDGVPSVVRVGPDGTATDGDGNPVWPDPQTHVWRRMSPGGSPSDASGPDGGDGTDPVQTGSGSDPDPDPDPDPIGPVDPLDLIP